MNSSNSNNTRLTLYPFYRFDVHDRVSPTGKNSCRVAFRGGPGNGGHQHARFFNRKMTFDPALGVGDAKCPCEMIDRWGIIRGWRRTDHPYGSDCTSQSSHVRCVAELSELPTRGVQITARNMTSKVFVCPTRPIFLCGSPKTTLRVKMS